MKIGCIKGQRERNRFNKGQRERERDSCREREKKRDVGLEREIEHKERKKLIV